MCIQSGFMEKGNCFKRTHFEFQTYGQFVLPDTPRNANNNITSICKKITQIKTHSSCYKVIILKFSEKIQFDTPVIKSKVGFFVRDHLDFFLFETIF